MTHYRIALLSDIHATITALDAVLEDIEQFAPLDLVVIAGDFTYGPSQTLTIERLSSYPVVAVLGNGDVELLEYADGKAPAYKKWLKQFSLIRWSFETTNHNALAFLRGLPEQRIITLPGADPIRLVHGSPRRINEHLGPEESPNRLEEVMNDLAEPVLVFGHTHRPLLIRQNNWLAVNPGAVSMAVGKPATAYYAILDWLEFNQCWEAHPFTVPYDPEAVTKEFADSGLLDVAPLGPLLLDTCLKGESVGVSYMRYALGLAKESGCDIFPYIPDDIWELAAQTYPEMRAHI